MESKAQTKRRLAFVIWNFEITEWEAFTRLVDRVSRQGFTTVRLHLSWFNAEKIPGVYDFAPYDEQIAYIAGKGMDVILTVDLQRKVHTLEDGTKTALDAVIDTDEFQYAYGADTHVPETLYGTAMVSYASPRGTECMVRFYAAAVSHFAERFGPGVIAFAYPTFTPYCETEYWCAGAYDYSVHMKRAFCAYLSSVYETAADLNLDLGTDYPTFDAVPMPDDSERGVLGVLFYQCRHRVLKALIDRLSEAQKTAAPIIPFAVQFGCVWDGASVRRCTYGFADLSEKADLVVVDDAPGFDHAFSMDYVASVLDGSGKTFGNEIDGYYMIADGVTTAEGYIEQGLTSYRHNASVQYVANWMVDEPLSNYGYIFSTISQEYLEQQTPDTVTENSDQEQVPISLLKLFETGDCRDYQEDYRHITDDGERFGRIAVCDDLTAKVYPNSIAGKDIKIEILTPADAEKQEEEKKSVKDAAMAVAAFGAAAAILALGVAVKVFFSDKDEK
ncbi:MAG: hypothetical protein E7604_04500 [Ruminococcaceae bacterium]|nr:hypothetical protein [Oscillospiraceae bacterium]